MKALPSTKERFALALRELLESNSFESISVGDIVGLSGAGYCRVVFYFLNFRLKIINLRFRRFIFRFRTEYLVLCTMNNK